MGVLNVTPDSFSDGGCYLDPAAAVAHGLELAAQGASIIDVGGESTRPGAEPVGAKEEMRRVLPVIEELSGTLPDVQISIDTSKAQVAAAALNAGASMLNDVTALRGDPEMAAVVAQANADCCLMHMLGEPRTMQDGVGGSSYKDVVDDVKAFLEERMSFAISAGVAEEKLLLDPGIGFGKTTAHNLELLRRLPELVQLGRPVMIGTSRKSFLGRVVAAAIGAEHPLAVSQRLPATIATNVLAFERGAKVLRVHDVAAVRDALALAAATLGVAWTSTSASPQRKA